MSYDFAALHSKLNQEQTAVKFTDKVVGEALQNFPIKEFEQTYPAKTFNKPDHWKDTERNSALHLPLAPQDAQVEVQFSLNSQRVEIKSGQVDPSITLHDFLKQYSRLSGTKKVCAQGGCGSCTVTVGRFDADSKKWVSSSANACLVPVGTLHGLCITTTEGLGSCQTGFHPVQQRVADFNGSQCGYCTPGMVMAVYSKLKTLEPDLPNDFDMQHTIDGNLCRCTGYMPLVNALGSFSEGGAERNAKVCYSKSGKVPPYDPQSDPAYPEPFGPKSSTMTGNGKVWARPATLQEAMPLLQKKNVQVVSGNTGLKGLYPTDTNGKTMYVDVSQVQELHCMTLEGTTLEVGAATTIETLGTIMNLDKRGCHARFAPVISKLQALSLGENLSRIAQQVYNIAGVHVRNRATVGGNMVLTKLKPEHFPSDLAGQFLALGASLKLVNITSGVKSSKGLAEWLQEAWDPSDLIVALSIPLPKDVYLNQRAVLRSQNCHAYLSSALSASIHNGLIKDVKLAVGALPQAMLAKKTAQELEGKSAADLLKNGWGSLAETFRKEIVFTDSHDLEYRQMLLNTFLYKFLNSLAENGSVNTYASLPRSLPKSNDVNFVNMQGREEIAGDIIPKHTSWAQASGEIKYAGDVEMSSGGLNAFMVTSPVAHGILENVDASKALKMEGVVAFLDHRDIPGANTVTAMTRKEPLFVQENVTYLGQPIGMIVAETSWQAEAAAKEVMFNIKPLDAIMTIDQAIAAGQFLPAGEVPLKETKKGESTKVLETDTANSVRFSGEWQSGQAKHFYLERQVAMATPRVNEHGNGDGVDMWHACQSPSIVQATVANCLGVPSGWVQLKQHMVGGGFGGKCTRNVPTACAAAVAAVRLNRPVRIVQDIATDLGMNGGRHPCKLRYSGRVDKTTGKLLAVSLESYGGQAYLPDLFGAADNHVGKAVLAPWANYSPPPHVISQSKCCVLNIPPSTFVRGPTDPKKSMAVETIWQHAAVSAGLPLIKVQHANMNVKLDGGTQPKLWKQLVESSEMTARSEDVKAFNAQNKLKKRGIALAPCLWNVPPIPATCTVAIYHGGGATAPDGSITITLGSAEIGQGIHTKVAQACQDALSKHPLLSEKVPLELIRVVGNNTEVIPAYDMVGGSGSNPQAVRCVVGACEQLIAKLTVHTTMNPVKKKNMTLNRKALGLDGKKMTWSELIATCVGPFGLAGADLVARNTVFLGMNNNEGIIKQMLQGKMTGPHASHGAAVTEVEVDVLTGEHVILRSDILYGQPRSVNPVIDLGQIQGAFVMGLGFFTKEYTEYSEDGKTFITKDTWEYKPPQVQDIPQQFNVNYFRSGSMKGLVFGSKGVGEPPLFMAVSVVNAIREAIMSARADGSWVDVSLPATPARISTACAIDASTLSKDTSLWSGLQNEYRDGGKSGYEPCGKAVKLEEEASGSSLLMIGAGLVLVGAIVAAVRRAQSS